MHQRLKAARTRIGNLTQEKTAAWQDRDKALRVQKRTVAAVKADCRQLRAAFHADKVHGTATLERKAWQTEASQIVNEMLDELLRKIDR